MQVERHASDLGRWRTVRRPARPALRPFAGDLIGADSDLPAALVERHLPSLSVGLLVNFGAPHRLLDRDGERPGVGAWVVGLQTGLRLGHAAGARSFMIVQLSPIGAHGILRLPMDAITDRTVPLEDIDPQFARDLVARTAAAADWPGRFEAAETLLAERLAGRSTALLAARALARLTQATEPPSVAALADELGCSHRHLIAQMQAGVGLSPKTVARIARFDRAVGAIHAALRLQHRGEPHLDQAAPTGRGRRQDDVHWADFAAAHGYYDQAHLIRDFQAFGGASPAQFLASLRPPATS